MQKGGFAPVLGQNIQSLCNHCFIFWAYHGFLMVHCICLPGVRGVMTRPDWNLYTDMARLIRRTLGVGALPRLVFFIWKATFSQWKTIHVHCTLESTSYLPVCLQAANLLYCLFQFKSRGYVVNVQWVYVVCTLLSWVVIIRHAWVGHPALDVKRVFK